MRKAIPIAALALIALLIGILLSRYFLHSQDVGDLTRTDLSGIWKIVLLNTQFTGAYKARLEIFQVGERLQGTLTTNLSKYQATGNRDKDKVLLDLEHDLYSGRKMTLTGTLQGPTGIIGKYSSSTAFEFFGIPFKLGTGGEWYAQRAGSESCPLPGSWSVLMQVGLLGKQGTYRLSISGQSGNEIYGNISIKGGERIASITGSQTMDEVTLQFMSSNGLYKMEGTIFNIRNCILIGNIFKASDIGWIGIGSWKAIKD